jgi:hypothetical protein
MDILALPNQALFTFASLMVQAVRAVSSTRITWDLVPELFRRAADLHFRTVDITLVSIQARDFSPR